LAFDVTAAWRLAAATLFSGAALFVSAQSPGADTDVRRARAAVLMNDLMLGKEVGGDFALSDARGRKRRLSDFRGKVVVLYFGFTTCPDICPTDMLAIGKALKGLGTEARLVQPIFVTLDPARDKPAMIAEYVKNFDSRFVALTGTDAEIRKVADAYKVFYERVPIPGAAGYTIDHSSFTYVVDRQGRYVGFIPPGTPYDRITRLLHAEVVAAP
jgi:cytochrome oxidase Cu insertion factor (SCO1/SenC/PrrC family)